MSVKTERKTEKLEKLLGIEKSRKKRLADVMKGVDSSSESSLPFGGSSSLNSYDSRIAMNTISPMLMQCRYDELSCAYKRCLKFLNKRERAFKDLTDDKEVLESKCEELLKEKRELWKNIENLCCKYFALRARNEDQIYRLKDSLTYLMNVLSSRSVMLSDKESNFSYDDKEF